MTSTKVMKLTKPSTADSTVVAYGGAAADMADHDRGRCVVHLEPMVSDVASTSSNTVQQPADLALWMAGSSPVTKFTQVTEVCYLTQLSLIFVQSVTFHNALGADLTTECRIQIHDVLYVGPASALLRSGHALV